MSNPVHTSHGIKKGLGHLVVRIWALLILLVVIWTGYAAVHYLAVFVFSPVRTSPEFVRTSRPIQASDVQSTADAGGSEADLSRISLGQYHRTTRWNAPATFNSCTTSGCHGPLPHTRSKELRAFANSHVTFMTCQMCHESGMTAPARAEWLTPDEGEVRPAPAVLQLIGLFEEPIPAEVQAFSDKVIPLLEEAVTAARGDGLLQYLLVELKTSEPGSPVWRRSMVQLADELPRHARGDYAAYLTPAVAGRDDAAMHAQIAEQAAKYLALPEGDAGRKSVYTAIHAKVSIPTPACVGCHGADPPRFDFADAGYAPTLLRRIQATPLAEMMQRINASQPFELPRMLDQP